MKALLLTLGSASMVIACAAAPDEDTANVSSALDVRDCHSTDLTDARARQCISQLQDTIHQRPYCNGANGGALYTCVDFSNTYCDAARANAYGCAELGVDCLAPTSPSGRLGHAVSVIYVGGMCYAIEPQADPLTSTGLLAGPWPPENGSCNTFPPSVADKVCASVGLGQAICEEFTHDDPRPRPWTDCRTLAR